MSLCQIFLSFLREYLSTLFHIFSYISLEQLLELSSHFSLHFQPILKPCTASYPFRAPCKPVATSSLWLFSGPQSFLVTAVHSSVTCSVLVNQHRLTQVRCYPPSSFLCEYSTKELLGLFILLKILLILLLHFICFLFIFM